MIKRQFKKLLKNGAITHKILVNLLFLYLKLAYLTSKWTFEWPQGWDKEKINQLDGALFALWHNRLAYGMYIFQKIDNVHALASPHTDGKIITDIIRKMKYAVIEGSTNRNPTGALKEIIKKINAGGKVVITPDGPRGPVYKINSSITKIAKKENKIFWIINVNLLKSLSKFFSSQSVDTKFFIAYFSLYIFGDILLLCNNF